MLLFEGQDKTMKVAVPEYQGRIAPVFDTCRHVLIFDQQEDRDVMVGNEDWSFLARHQRPARLRELGVETLLCGGISCRMEDLINLQGIKTIAWLAGHLPDLLAALREGRVSDPCYSMPGRRCRRQGRTIERRSGIEIGQPKRFWKGVT